MTSKSLSVGTNTSVCSLSDQVKKYKSKNIISNIKLDELKEEKDFITNTANNNNKLSYHIHSRERNIDSLALMCIKILTNEFILNPEKTSKIPFKYQQDIIDRLPTDLNLNISGPYIISEKYWKKACLMNPSWSNGQISNHGLSWKHMYIEKKIQEILENYVQENEEDAEPKEVEEKDKDKEDKQEIEINSKDIDEHILIESQKDLISTNSLQDSNHKYKKNSYLNLLDTIQACGDSIFQLKIEQLLSHIDMEQLLMLLPNLCRLELTYGVKNIGMKYERMLFGMKISDATSLAYGLKSPSTCLTTLKLPNNLIDDDLLRTLMTGLIKNYTITILDLSHNKISDQGARLLAKLLGPENVLTHLSLADNRINAEGGKYLSRGLKNNESLIELNLKLNRLTDEGGKYIIEGLYTHPNLISLDLNSNSLGRLTANAFVSLMNQNNILQIIHLCGNDMTEEDASLIKEGLEKNNNIIDLDIRQNQIPKESPCINEIAAIVRRNEINIKI